MTDSERRASIHRVIHVGSDHLETEADARSVARGVEQDFGYRAEVRHSDRAGWTVLNRGPLDPKPPAA